MKKSAETAAAKAKRLKSTFRSLMHGGFRGYTPREGDLELAALLRAEIGAAVERFDAEVYGEMVTISQLRAAILRRK